ncbi:Chaperone protein dnaJ 6 [Diplonema papillatum]|nr:Chaperone protein dnaJ 6 [Diplonema papillatum]|eukprot:gene15812-24154_t
MANLIARGECLYAVLGTQKGATEADLKGAYRKLALKCHPDRLQGKKAAEKKRAEKQFKKVGFAYSILRDAGKRKEYDETGIFAAGDDAEDLDMSTLMRSLFRQVTEDDCTAYAEKYKGSDEERADVINGYNKSAGDFMKTLDHVHYNDLLASEEDRLNALIESLVAEGELKATEKWEKTKLTPERKESDAYKKRWAARLKEAEEVRQSEEYLKATSKKVKDPKKAHSKQSDLMLAMGEVMRDTFRASLNQMAAKFGVSAEEMNALDEDPGADFMKAFAAAKETNKKRKRDTTGADGVAAGDAEEEESEEHEEDEEFEEFEEDEEQEECEEDEEEEEEEAVVPEPKKQKTAAKPAAKSGATAARRK